MTMTITIITITITITITLIKWWYYYYHYYYCYYEKATPKRGAPRDQLTPLLGCDIHTHAHTQEGLYKLQTLLGMG